MDHPDIWIIWCREEGEEKEADIVDKIDFKCKGCGRIYDAESTSAYNPAIVEQYRREYNATKNQRNYSNEEGERERDIDFTRDAYQDNI